MCVYVCVRVCVCVCVLFSITRQVVGTLELVGDVATLKNLEDQLLTLRLHLLLQGDLYLPHYLGLTYIHTYTYTHTHIGSAEHSEIIPHMGCSAINIQCPLYEFAPAVRILSLLL